MLVPRAYLDNAATSWPKPEGVYRAIDQWMRSNGAAAGRGLYAEAIASGEIVAAARRGISRLIGAESPDRIVFCANGTDALNLAIHGALRPGDHVVTTVWEHNSVLRPLRTLQDDGRIELTLLDSGGAFVVDPQKVESALRPNTRLIAVVHASNVTGALQPAAAIGAIARRRRVLFLLDAAQTLGELPIDVRQLQVDLLAAPGHKGLLGPLGTGLLYVRPGIEKQLASVRQGGTGTESESDRQPDAMPDKFESGNLNVPGLAGLLAAIEYLNDRGIDSIRAHSLAMTERLLAGLLAQPGLVMQGPREACDRAPVVSICVPGFDPQEAATALDLSFGVQVRSGLHCAPEAHRALGTLATGGTVRYSLGPFTTAQEIDQAIAATAALCGANPTAK